MKRKKKDEFSDRQELSGPNGEAITITGINYITPNGNNADTNNQTTPSV